MKRTISVLIAALMLTGMLTACSGTMTMDDGRAYGNVSTTRDGTVNGTNGYTGNGYENRRDQGSYQNGGSYGSTYGNGSYNGYQNGGGSGMGTDMGAGTGMTGGR